jgi:hypothetical protein
MKAFMNYSETNYIRALDDPAVLTTMRQMLYDANATAGNTIYGQRISLLIGLINSNFNGTEVNISSCQDLISPTSTYKLTANVNSTGTCFNIGHVGITLDCQGHNITYGTGGGANNYGIRADWTNAITVKNCNIRNSPASTGMGIYISRSHNATLINNTINVSSKGVWFVAVNGLNIIQNRIIAGTEEALSTQSLENGSFTYNTLSSNSGYGLYMFDTHHFNVTWNNASSYSGYGATVFRSNNSIFTNNRFTSTTGSGFWEYQSSNNTYVNNTILP